MLFLLLVFIFGGDFCQDDLSPYDVLKQLSLGNQNYVAAKGMLGDISSKRRLDVARVFDCFFFNCCDIERSASNSSYYNLQ
jgi:hypothetical protein